MSDDEAKYLDAFSGWLSSRGTDAEAHSGALGAEGTAPSTREAAAGGLNYLFKSLELIPDGIDDIGYLDDAFVLRAAADVAMRQDVGSLEADDVRALNRLAEDADAIKEFLGEDYARLEGYVVGLRKGASRGRSVPDILADTATQAASLHELRGFARSYQPPPFAREDKNLVKLKAFFDAKLPR